jgi:hypothetical protein
MVLILACRLSLAGVQRFNKRRPAIQTAACAAALDSGAGRVLFSARNENDFQLVEH